MILADTSVWVSHLRMGDVSLMDALNRGEVASHPFVIGELACGNLANRRILLSSLADLPRTVLVEPDVVLEFIESRGLAGVGIGYVDAHLLASCHHSQETTLWTLDKRLAMVADQLGLAFK